MIHKRAFWKFYRLRPYPAVPLEDEDDDEDEYEKARVGTSNLEPRTALQLRLIHDLPNDSDLIGG
jgi:hypothetical protein